MLALGYLIGEIYRRKRNITVQDMETDTIEDSKLEATFATTVNAIGMADHQHDVLLMYIFESNLLTFVSGNYYICMHVIW